MIATKQLLDLADAILVAAGGPVSIEDVVAALTAAGAVTDEDGDFKKQKHDVYSKLWLEMKKHGDAARWQRVGRGLFCAAPHLTAEMLMSESTKVKTLGEIREKAQAAGRAPREKRGPVVLDGTQTCGNCTHLRFYGPHFMNLDSGSCERWPESGQDRAYPRVELLACPLWRRRTDAQRQDDLHQRDLDRIAILSVNSGRIREKGAKRELGAKTVVLRHQEDDDA